MFFMELSQPRKGKEEGRTFPFEPRGFKQRQGRASSVTDSIWQSLISKNWMLKSVFGVVYGAHNAGICVLPWQEADFTPW